MTMRAHHAERNVAALSKLTAALLSDLSTLRLPLRSAGRELDLLIYRMGCDIVTVDQDQVEIARRAWRRFGKCRHQAALNYGDFCTHALAVRSSLPVLCIGKDFIQTDIASVKG